MVAAFAVFLTSASAVDDVWDYSVQVSSTVQASPAKITLNWLQDTNGTPASYTVYRKAPSDASWGTGTTLAGTALTYTDSNITTGIAYEYRIVKATSGYTGYGYIETGIDIPAIENRGKVILIVDRTMATPLAAELARLNLDLRGDGWTVLRHDVGREDSVSSVKDIIRNDYNADPANVKSVFLLGHIPVPYSGNFNPDGHPDHVGAWPADAYYGDMDGTWTDQTVNYIQNLNTDPVDAARITNTPGDGKFDQSDLPSNVELQVGRVDLANMPGRRTWGGPATMPSETELLRKYLNKDHAFRTGVTHPARRAILGEYFGIRGGEAFAASGFRSFAPLVGPANVRNLNTEFNDQKGVWIPQAAQTDNLLAYACGPGSYTSISGIGSSGLYNDGTTYDMLSSNVRGVFNLIFGSWLGDWDHEDDFLRSPLATDYGLVSVWSGRPHWFLHPMGVGETIGYITRLTQNNVNTYETAINTAAHRVHIALMGDPTLRLHSVVPVTSVTGTVNGGTVSLTWGASTDTGIVGYHVYRATAANGTYTRLTAAVVTDTSFTDSAAPAGATYMVRAIKLESTPSGSYYNPSEGAFWSAEAGSSGGVADTTAPVVSISSPSAGTVVSGTSVNVTADATDNVAVTGVQFKLDGSNLGSEVTSTPYAAMFNPTTLANGAHTLGAVARDSAANMASATPVTINVSNFSATTGSPVSNGTSTTTAIANGTSSSGPVVASSSSSASSSSIDPTNGTVLWIDDALPAGATDLASNGGDSWNWVATNPAPFAGTLAHRSDVAAGQHGHWFGASGAPLIVNNGEILFTYVYLDPANPPAEIMLSWSTDNSWEHRAYWGADKINLGSGQGRYYAGPLPATGQWVRLSVPASAVGLDQSIVTAMGFSLFDGGATFDAAGKTVPVAPALSLDPTASTSSTSGSGTKTSAETTWFDDSLPSGAGGVGSTVDTWNWVSNTPTPISGSKAHKSDPASGLHSHWFGWADSPFTIASGDKLFAYVYLDPANPPTEVMIAWSTNASWDHRAYWGADNITIGSGAGHYRAGALPSSGQWVRLEVPASAIGVEGAAVTGMSFMVYDGSATWDKTGKFTGAVASTGWTASGNTGGGATSGPSTSGGSTTGGGSTSTSSTGGGSSSGGTSSGGTSTTPSSTDTSSTSGGSSSGSTSTSGGTSSGSTSTSGGTTSGSTSTGGSSTSTSSTSGTPSISSADTVWIDDSLPPGAGGEASNGGDAWTWVSSAPSAYSGSLAHQSNIAAGQHGHWFSWSGSNLSVGTGDKLFTYAYLDPANPPSQVMLSWSTTSSWDHRAYWGADKLQAGSGAGYFYAGPLPASGQWVRLEVPASAVGMEGSSATAMGFTLYDGRATFDAAGRWSATGSGGTASGSGSTSGGGTSGGGSTTTSTNTVTIVSGESSLSQVPNVGDYELRILTPTVLELRRIVTKPANASFTDWNFVDANGNFTAPNTGEFTVTVNGQIVGVSAVNFRRITAYGQLYVRDLRAEASLYLTLSSPIADGQSVAVTNPDGSLWPSAMKFESSAAKLRFNPAIHVNEEGYVPAFTKKAMVGYYLGDGGELAVDASKGFTLVNTSTGATVYTGTLTHRVETGYQISPLPYQKVYEADFSSFTTPGEYRVVVPGMGASLAFRIDDGIAMAVARTYELGLYHQRCGTSNDMPYTRFTHGACHTAAAAVPTSDPAFDFTWKVITSYSGGQSRQTAPQLTSVGTQLYPFVNQGTVDVSGGHHDAGDYSKYTIDVALLAHQLLFTADNIAGAGSLDNLGIPESGDGISDIMQEGKWEADYVAKLQDADGGFYFIVYPKNREYEGDVSPEFGDAQVVWPKNTSATAACVGVLAEYASSPRFKQAYPAVAASYLAKAKLGWQFLTNAIAKYGKDGAYQKITFYGDEWMHDDELAWAAAAMYAATGDAQYQTQLLAWFPNPADPNTWHWTWQRMYQGYGCAIRDYAFAARSGRLTASQLDPTYLAACEAQVTAAGDDVVSSVTGSAYGSSFPTNIKHAMQTGWFFSMDTASDAAVAYQISPKQAYFDAVLSSENYEIGCNPANTSFLAGLGVRRPTQMVSQYRNNNRHILPPDGEPISNVRSSFSQLWLYSSSELDGVSFPAPTLDGGSYPLQDRYSDIWNVQTEFVTLNQGRSLTAAAFLAAQTPAKSTAWKPANTTAQIVAPSIAALGVPITLSLGLNGLDVSNARITWEARDQQPSFGNTFTITPRSTGANWVEVEIAYPDGRRVFVNGSFNAQ